MAVPSPLHESALDRLNAGKASDAIALLREAIVDTLDPEIVNDLAVVLAGHGEAAQAQVLLEGLVLMCPHYEPALANLRSMGIDGGDVSGAPAAAPARTRDRASDDTSRMADATSAFLQLVAEAQARCLPDNLDTLFHPYGHELPDAAGAGVRLAQQLRVLQRAEVLWRRLGDDQSRDLWLRFLAYRALGPAHVRLRSDPVAYRRAVIGLTSQRMVRPMAEPTPGFPFEWALHQYDLRGAGLPIQIIGPPLALASTYCFSQYAYLDTTVAGRPSRGDVAVDAGGCWGETALWLAHVVGEEGRVHTFEPSPRNRSLLQRNLDLNPDLASRVTVHDSPLGPRPGETVWIDNVLAAGATVRDQAADAPAAVQLQSESIDSLVQRGVIERVDFLKVDVEGADLGLLQGAAATIAQQRPRLAIAAYHRPDDLVEIPAFIESLGVDYHWYLQCSTMTDVDTVAFGVPA